MTAARATLSLADLEAFDPGAPERGAQRRFLCPLPACSAKRPDAAHRSLCVNTASGAWLCHRCGAHGTVRERWNTEPRRSPRERARAALRQAFAVDGARPAAPGAPSDPPGADPDRPAAPRPPREAGDWRNALRDVRPLAGTPGEAYLHRRGIALDLAHEAGVRHGPDWYGRPAVLFPIYDRDGALVACQGRYVDGRDDPKTRTAGPKSRGVFATPGAREADRVAIVEAPIDALSLAACGLPAVALAGTTAPDWLPVACAFKRVLLATDADAAGEEAALKLAPAFGAHGARVARLRPARAKDWNEALQTDPEGLRRSLRSQLGAPASGLGVEGPEFTPSPAPRVSCGCPPEAILQPETGAGVSPFLSGAALVAAVMQIFGGRRVSLGSRSPRDKQFGRPTGEAACVRLDGERRAESGELPFPGASHA
jgi:Toprim-like